MVAEMGYGGGSNCSSSTVEYCVRFSFNFLPHYPTAFPSIRSQNVKDAMKQTEGHIMGRLGERQKFEAQAAA